MHVDSWRSTYSGIVPERYLNGMSYSEYEPRWRDRIAAATSGEIFIHVAESAEEGVVGFASGGPSRGPYPEYAGELYAIYLFYSWQRRGLGRKLFASVANSMAGAGLCSMLTWALKENPYRGFYEKLGGGRVGEREVEIGGARLMEVAYGWGSKRLPCKL